ncbi:MAG: 4Fe-4S dicluster domain-containing protein [Deltaproteobacteria bacterium]|nr:MAG: 4Fe-4S dicluster domain-containing protein [Deltaproteobacteria bacterium]
MDWVVLGALVLGGALGVVKLAAALRAREARDTQAFEAARKADLHIPASLHPVIDPDRCIGSLACVRACPEGDIIGIVEGAGRLIEGSRCIGHGACYRECPVDAIRLVFGSSERGIDLPELGSDFESSRAGVYIVGELGGMGLIRNAMTQGIEVVSYLKARLRPRPGVTDVVIVGAGPAGLATAAACIDAGLSYRLLEQQSLGGTVAHYPRQKLVMSEPVEIPGYGRFGKRRMRKEEVIAEFDEVVRRLGIRVEEGVRVVGLEGGPGAFEIETTGGPVTGQAVVLAIGRRGTPRRLGVPGEDLPKVTYRLIEPEQYAGCRVLVVGGGDSALESAILLAEETDAEVAISYRRQAFGRCRPTNKQKIEALIAARRVVGLMGTEVEEIRPDSVVLRPGQRRGAMKNDYVIVNIGGELPRAFLEKVGVEIRRHHGEDRGRGAPSWAATSARSRIPCAWPRARTRSWPAPTGPTISPSPWAGRWRCTTPGASA